MWPFSHTSPEAELYPSPKNVLNASPVNSSKPEDNFNPEEQEKYQALARELKFKNLPEDQSEFSPEDQERIARGGHEITFNTPFAQGIPSVNLAYAYDRVAETFPEQNLEWKRRVARELAPLLREKNHKN